MKYKITRKQYLGKNCLGEHIYKMWRVAFKRHGKVMVAIDVIVDTVAM